MKNEIRAGNKVLAFDEPQPTQFERFKEDIGGLMVAFVRIQTFLENIENGKIDSFDDIIEKQIGAIKEASKGLEKMATLFYGILKNATIDGVEMTRDVFDDAFNYETVDNANTILTAIQDYIGRLSPTEAEQKN